MIMNKMPDIGDIYNTENLDEEAQKNIKAFQALLNWKENKTYEIRQEYEEKLRKITFDRNNYEKKC